MIHLADDFRIISEARTKEILPQVDHKSPIFDRMHVKRLLNVLIGKHELSCFTLKCG